MGQKQNKIHKTLINLPWLLVLQVFTTAHGDRPEFTTTELKIRNGMYGMNRTEIIYHCRGLTGSRLDYGWRRAKNPPLGHSFSIIVEGGGKLQEEVHSCHFRSALGTADIEIRTTAIDAEICVKKSACAVHVATREGIVFEGKEWDFSERYPKLKNVRYVEAQWKPWPPRNRRGRTHGRA